jgi:hypothetical protein
MPLDPTHVRFEANTRVTNGIPLGSSPLLPVDTVICVATLKATTTLAPTLTLTLTLTMNSVQTLKATGLTDTAIKVDTQGTVNGGKFIDDMASIDISTLANLAVKATTGYTADATVRCPSSSWILLC